MNMPLHFDKKNKHFYIRGCDCCGKINAPVTKDGNRRVTLCCITKGGFYHTSEMKKGWGSGGKTIRYYLRFPIHIKWQGFWGYGRP